MAVYYNNSGVKRHGANRRSSGAGTPPRCDPDVEIDPIIVRGAVLWTSQRAWPSLDPHLVEGGFRQTDTHDISSYIEKRIGRWRNWRGDGRRRDRRRNGEGRTDRCQSKAAFGNLGIVTDGRTGRAYASTDPNMEQASRRLRLSARRTARLAAAFKRHRSAIHKSQHGARETSV